jgi:hypothetical protein
MSSQLVITTRRALDYFEAFNRLDGYQRSIEVNGRKQVVMEAYDLSAKFVWNCAKNKNLLRPIKEAFEAEREAASARIRAIKVAFAPPSDADKDAIEVAYAQHVIKVDQAEAAEDAKLAALGKQENTLDGLLKLPAAGIKIRSRDPGLIAILDLLMNDFIEGEPNFGDTSSA